jgi:quercetin dioxygenase-like cupin family protein
MYVINYEQREEIDVTLPGTLDTKMRWLVGCQTGAKTYAMRYFDVQPGGIIPEHTHPEEHEIFILQGEAKLLGDGAGGIAKKDDIVFIPSEEPHGYDNREGKEPFRFICVIPLLDQD